MPDLTVEIVPRALVKAALPTAIFLYPECLNHFGGKAKSPLVLAFVDIPSL